MTEMSRAPEIAADFRDGMSPGWFAVAPGAA
jgi:hypothetical protein